MKSYGHHLATRSLRTVGVLAATLAAFAAITGSASSAATEAVLCAQPGSLGQYTADGAVQEYKADAQSWSIYDFTVEQYLASSATQGARASGTIDPPAGHTIYCILGTAQHGAKLTITTS